MLFVWRGNELFLLTTQPLSFRPASLTIQRTPHPRWSYFLWLGKGGYVGARDYGTELLKGPPPSSILVAEYTPYQTLAYLQGVDVLRLDVEVI